MLVASDAIGMGLNLNIRRIIFQTLFKFTGGDEVTVSTSAIKQIAGRAGRHNSAYSQVNFEHAGCPALAKKLEPQHFVGMTSVSSIVHF